MSDDMIKAGGNGRYGRSFDLLNEIGFKDVKRYDHIRKFGTNPALSTSAEDIWDQGGLYVFPADAGVAMTISSSSTDDADGGSGAESVDIIGLDATGLVLRVTAEMNGQTAVAVGTFSRVFRAIVMGSQVAVGDIYIGTGAVSSGVPANKFAKIVIGAGQTQMAIFTVPSNMEGLLKSWRASFHVVGTASNEVDLFVRTDGNQFVSKDSLTLRQAVNPADTRNYLVGEYLAPFTDIKVQMDVSTGTPIGHAGFEIILRELVNPVSNPTKGL